MNVNIRPLATNDVTEVLEIRLSVTENAVSVERLAELNISEESLCEMLDHDHFGFVAQLEKSIVGFAMANAIDANIFALFVRSESEGQGLGKKLLSKTLNKLYALGHSQANLSTDKNTRAFDFYIFNNWCHVSDNEQGEAVLEIDLNKNTTSLN